MTAGWGVRLGLHLVKGIGEQHEALLDGELARGPYASLADVVERTGFGEEVLERLIRIGAMDGARVSRDGRCSGNSARWPRRPEARPRVVAPASGRRSPAGRWTCAFRPPRRRTCRR